MLYAFDECAGCLSCEIACGYKSFNSFNRHNSLIRVIEMDSGFRIRFTEKGEVGDLECDGCAGMEKPVCVTYCPYPVRLTEIVKEYVKTRN